MSKRIFCAVQLLPRQALIVLGFLISLEGAGDIVAAHLEQQLALLYRVAEPGVDLHHSAGGQRDGGHGAGDIGLHHAGHVQLRRRFVLDGGDQRKLLGMVHLEVVGVHVRDDGCLRRRLGGRVGLGFLAASKKQTREQSESCE